MKKAVLITLVLIGLAPAAHALRPGATTVIFPIIGRFEGAMHTQWRTDVFVRNIHGSETVRGTMTFYVANGPALQAPMTLAPVQSATYRDIVLSVFGLEQASGQLHLTTEEGIIIEARGRIYNSGHPAGEFGQGIEGLGKDSLQRQALVFGLDGTRGSRVNVGIANPNGFAVTVRMRIADRNSEHLYWEEFDVQPYQTRQFNDIFALFGIAPQENVSVEFNGGPDTPLYGYSSEVRNDTGDAIFVFGTGPNAPSWP
jgi:hypothetical protein